MVVVLDERAMAHFLLDQQIVRTQMPIRHRQSRLLGEFPKALRLFRPEDPMPM